MMSAYVRIQISGKRTERLLERMRHALIFIYVLRRVSETSVELVLSAKDFKRLPPLARNCGCHIHILQRMGSAFVFQRFVRRYALWGSTVCMFLLMLLASTRILHIDIDGCSKIAERTILRALSEEGIRIGSSNRGWDFPTLNNRLRMYDERIAWVGLSIDGVVLRVKIVESILTAEDPYSEEPTEIVAKKSGRITKIQATAGKALVAIGDVVSAGECLITGNLTTEESQYPVVMRAEGAVFAEVAYIGESVAESEVMQFTDTGEVTVYREVLFAGKTLFTTPIPYANYVLRDCKQTEITDTLLPILLMEGLCCEQTEELVQLEKDAMIEAALYEAEERAFLKIPKDAVIVKKKSAWMESEGNIHGIVTILTEETIGLTKEIDVGDYRQNADANNRIAE